MYKRQFVVGVESLGDIDTIAPAVQKGNTELLNWLNDEIKTLAKEKFFHKDFDETLKLSLIHILMDFFL